jgi:hypothetical protein
MRFSRNAIPVSERKDAVSARPESDEALVQRLLPRSNADPHDRADAWREWYAKEGEPFVLAFIKAKNDTLEPDMDILQEAIMTAYAQVEQGRYEPRLGGTLCCLRKGHRAQQNPRSPASHPAYGSLGGLV